MFREHSADITQCISLDVMRVTDRLFAAKVIPEALRNEISTVLGLDDYKKANKLTVHIQNTLSSHSNPIEYLTDVCYALFLIDNETLKSILISILNKLGKPLPQGKDQCLKPIYMLLILYTDSRQDCSRSSSLLKKRPRAQGTYIIIIILILFYYYYYYYYYY